MTERENFIAYTRGGKAEWIPNFESCVQYYTPSVLEDPMVQLVMYMEEHDQQMPENFHPVDCTGIRWSLDELGAMPDPSFILLEDITEWKEKVRIPDLRTYDWDSACQMDSAWLSPDKATLVFQSGIFMQLINSMGHENAFCALYEEEEECIKYLTEYTDFLVEVIRNVFSRVKVDYFILGDDMASARDLFISPDCYRRVFKPLQKRIFDAVREVSPDTYREFHLCGHCEAILDDIVETGCEGWQPAQLMNDVKGFQQKHPGFFITGAWDNVKAVTEQGLTEEDIRRSVRESFDTYAREGAPYMFWNGGSMGTSNPETVVRLNWANDEAEKYGREYFQKNRVQK